MKQKVYVKQDGKCLVCGDEFDISKMEADHTTLDKWEEKVESAYQNGCRRFDAALKGYGGCPMAKDDLVGNMPTEKLITYFNEDLGLNPLEVEKSLALSSTVFK